MLVHNICKKHNINSEIEPNKFYLSKKKYFYCSECQKERRRKHYGEKKILKDLKKYVEIGEKKI